MKYISIFIFSMLMVFTALAQNNIAEARKMVGKTITIKGIVTNGSELGAIRYLQDETGGIAAYSSSFMQNVKKGDQIIVSGTLKDYSNLLEVDPVTSVEIVSSGNTLPTPAVITIDQIGEAYEGQLVVIKKVTFANAGSAFEGNKNYNFSADGKTGVLRLNKLTTAIVGQLVPSGEIDLITICSQYSYFSNDVTTGYQLLPRSMDDFVVEGAIKFSSVLNMTNLSKSGFKLNWLTDVSGTSEVRYGFSSESASLTHKTVGTETQTSEGYLHEAEITGIDPATLVWVEAYSVLGSDTASSSIRVFATQSNSSGDIKVYFNTPVDLTVSKGTDAIFLNNAIDDTLIAYIGRAKESIDFTIYNFNNNGISNISEALNAAQKRGVKIRLISCGTAKNLGLNDLDASVPSLESPGSGERDGIMHNKFVIFDAHSSDPNIPIVWTGATNFTDGQINTDPNNVIILQDQSLALGYELEFNEMWGSSTATPNKEKALYGSFKKDNTPHQYIIGGKQVESYFSPSDGTNQKIIDVINSADHDMSIATMLITRTDLAYSIKDAKARGASINILTNSSGDNTDAVNDILTSALGVQHFVFDSYVLGIMHHKYAVIDQDLPSSDPTVITGSHNWSAAANDKNDENTLIIHDATLANIYYQQFSWNFLADHGSFTDVVTGPVAVTDTVQVAKNDLVAVEVLNNDVIASAVDLTIEKEGLYGSTFIPFTNPNVINYQASNDFVGTDTILYRITYQTDASMFGVGKIIVNVGTDGVATISNNLLTMAPNPFHSNLTIQSNQNLKAIEVFDMNGRSVFKQAGLNQMRVSVDLSNLQNGVYFLKTDDSRQLQKIIKL